MAKARLIALFLSAALAAAAWLPAARAATETEAAQGPSAVVERLNETLIGVMRNADELGYRGRFERLAPALTETFDFQLMAAVSVGRHWRELDAAQRRRLIDAFRRMSIGTFADRFDGYSGERFRIVGEAPAPRDTVLVRNELIKSDGDRVEINYLLRQADGAWRVIDVFLDAKYSELAVKRSEYSAVMSSQGFESLIQTIEGKLAEMAATG